MGIKNGGQAFPARWSDGTLIPGMSMRDWFAGQALVSLHQEGFARVLAERAYEIADAMLEERRK